MKLTLGTLFFSLIIIEHKFVHFLIFFFYNYIIIQRLYSNFYHFYMLIKFFLIGNLLILLSEVLFILQRFDEIDNEIRSSDI